ncbi:MAG TPA: lamin tail domain-containing protein [Sedimentisphaerales bacterium]|nr:lamin tail domain-containing protein [Sedimentisphaerales bacterium]
MSKRFGMPSLPGVWLLCCWGILWVLSQSAEAAGPIITEFAASNDNGLTDFQGDSSDWIELHNPTEAVMSLEGWYLTDDLGDLTKWEIPEVSLGSGGYLIIFASGKNLRDPRGELHTNFSLQAEGESLALVEPDGQTIAFSYRDYPPQLGDISYGLGGGAVVAQTETVLISRGAAAKALIPTDGALGLSWTGGGFNDSSWLTGTTGVGYDYSGYTGLDVGAMQGRNQTVYVRIPFATAQTKDIDKLILRMRYEDGFVAWLNGREVARSNAPAQLSWNSGATTTRDDADAVVAQEFDITAHKDALVKGNNVLAIQGLNSSLNSSDLLILPELVAVDVGQIDLDQIVEGYLLKPTPGRANEGTMAQMGPIIRNVTKNPPPPAVGEDLVITAEVSPGVAAVEVVRLVYQINYEPGLSGTLAMLDDGLGVDAVAGDGVYTAVVPSQAYKAGDMVRWYVFAVDAQHNWSRNPLFAHPTDSPEYYGTVVVNPATAGDLPVLAWFTQSPSAASTRAGTRASVFFDGQFYDNVFVRQRGGATVGAGSKKFVFNTGYRFRFSDEYDRVKEFNLNQNGSDPTYLRPPLAFETMRRAGCPASQCFLVLSVLNRQVDGVGIFVEQVDRVFLERNGLDPHGALYKFVQRSQITPVFNDINSGIEKKTRKEENFSDIAAVVQGLNAATAEQRKIFVFDHFNLPGMMDYLAARCLLQDTDDIRKNFYFYRDSEGNGEWSIFPWDKDWTFGIVGDGWIYTSHPFLGDEAHAKDGGRQWSVFLDVMYNLPETREMFLRRTRTVMDELLQPPSTPLAQRFFENRIDELFAPARSRLGNLSSAVNSLKGYFPTRRTQLYVDHNIGNKTSQPPGGNAGLPNAQPEQTVIRFGGYDHDPSSGNQDEEYIELINPNAYAVDISGWRLAGGVEHTFLPGTVLLAGGRLYVTPNARAFRNRTISPRGGQGLFVQGDYKGHLSNWGETVQLIDRFGRVVDTLTYAGTPSEQQRWLRITEIMYNPAPGGIYDSQAYEFIELKNIGPTTLALDGVKLTEGVSYAFPPGGKVSLASGECIVIARNRAAFTDRYGADVRLAPGVFTGNLDNAGEKIKLEDRTNNTILEFKYRDTWRPETDGLGYSLTIKDATEPDLDRWGKSGAWQASTQQGGSPGS